MGQTQEREAKENMKRKAKELQRQRQDAMKYGRNTGYSGISGGGGGSGSSGRQDIQIVESVSADNPKPSSYTAAAPSRLVLGSQIPHIFNRTAYPYFLSYAVKYYCNSNPSLSSV